MWVVDRTCAIVYLKVTRSMVTKGKFENLLLIFFFLLKCHKYKSLAYNLEKYLVGNGMFSVGNISVDLK